MKKFKIFIKFYYLMMFAVLIINSIFVIKNNLYFNMSDLPTGKYQYSLSANKKNISVDVYLIKNTVGSAIRIESVDKRTKEKRNIYWQTGIENVELSFNDNSDLMVNGMPINIIKGGYYDCRRGLSILQSGSLYTESK